MEFLQYKNWKVQIQRKAFRRTLSIHLSLNEGILVKTSLLCKVGTILEFLRAKEKWIEKNLQKYESIKSQQPQYQFQSGEEYPLLGEGLNFDLVMEDPKLSPQQKKKKLFEIYKDYAQTELEKRMSFWSEQMNLKPQSLKFNQPKGRWGSCSSQGNINLNWKMIVYPSEVVDYVLIHELAHLKHMNHSKDFWKLVASYCPNYKDYQKELKKNFLKSSFLDLD